MTSPSRVPGGLPLLGHTPRMLRSPLEFFLSLRRYGEVVRIGLGPQRAYVVTEPELVRRILVQDAKKFERGLQFEKARVFLGDSLFTEPEPEHLRHRRLIQPAFHHARLAEYVDLMRHTVERQIQRWNDGGLVDIDHEALAFTVGVLCRALFSAPVPAATVAREVEQSLPVLLNGLALRIALPVGLLGRLPTRGNRRFEAARRGMRTVLEDVITGYRTDGTGQHDLMSHLLAAHDYESGERFDDEQLRDQALAIFIAGIETSAYTLAWVCHLLGRHPEVHDEVTAEVDRVLGGRAVSAGDLPELGALRRVITEALRLHPPVWLLSRRANEAVRLGAHEIPAGGQVLFSIYAIHHDPAVYDRPDAFRPDRWLDPRAVPRASFVAFGAGNRGCIGEPFAWTELLVFFAVLLRSWRLHPAPGTDVHPVVGTGLKPSPAPVLVRRRHAP